MSLSRKEKAAKARKLAALGRDVIDTAVMKYRVENEHVDFEVKQSHRDDSATNHDEAVEALLLERES